MSRQDAIYRIALAGICAALSLLLVWLSVVIRYSTIAFYVAAGIVLMIPMTQRYYLSSIFAFAVSAGLSFVIAGDIVAVAGYIVYFGPVSLITGFLMNIRTKWWLESKLKWLVNAVVKLVYINGALAILYFVLGTIVVSESIMEKVEYWMVALVGSIALMLIDVVQIFAFKYVSKVVGKVLRKNPQNQEEIVINDDEEEIIGDNPFDDFDTDTPQPNGNVEEQESVDNDKDSDIFEM